MDIKTLRQTARISQIELAARSGIGRVRLSFIENGHVSAKPEEREAIRRAVADQAHSLVEASRALLAEVG